MQDDAPPWPSDAPDFDTAPDGGGGGRGRSRAEVTLPRRLILCVLMGPSFDLDEPHGDAELFVSLDRIDDDEHQEAGDLQVVRRLANHWKEAGKDGALRRLIAVIRRIRSS